MIVGDVPACSFEVKLSKPVRAVLTEVVPDIPLTLVLAQLPVLRIVRFASSNGGKQAAHAAPAKEEQPK